MSCRISDIPAYVKDRLTNNLHKHISIVPCGCRLWVCFRISGKNITCPPNRWRSWNPTQKGWNCCLWPDECIERRIFAIVLCYKDRKGPVNINPDRLQIPERKGNADAELWQSRVPEKGRWSGLIQPEGNKIPKTVVKICFWSMQESVSTINIPNMGR